MSDINEQIKQSMISISQAKETIIVECINHLIKKDILTFYDQQMTSDFNSSTNTLTHRGACLLRESDGLLYKLSKLERLQSELDAVRFKNNEQAKLFSSELKRLANEHDDLLSELSAEREAASKLIEALEFIAMPLTKDTHTVQGLLDTVRTDTNKAIKALSEYKKARGENV